MSSVIVQKQRWCEQNHADVSVVSSMSQGTNVDRESPTYVRTCSVCRHDVFTHVSRCV